jgi:outer membrane protein TolC
MAGCVFWILTLTLLTVLPRDAFAQAAPAPTDALVRRLTVADAVSLALENNLGVQVARVDPQIQDLVVAQARTGWTPSFTSTFDTNSQDSPNNSFLAGAQGARTSVDTFRHAASAQQILPWGGNYTVSWDSSRLTTNSAFATFSPQLRSTVALSYSQPLLRGFRIDGIRYELQLGQQARDVSETQLRQTVATTLRTVRRAYWSLTYATALTAAQRQSLALAEQSLRDTRTRVEVGTSPGIDIVEAEAEVALREESVIVAETQISTAQDALRTLIYNTSTPGFWNLQLEAADQPAVATVAVDVDGAIRQALEERVDLERARIAVATTDVDVRFTRDQTWPDIRAQVNYGATGLGGTQLQRGQGPFGPGTGDVIGQSARRFSTVLNDLISSAFPTWTAGLSISYPLGSSQAHVQLAQARLRRSQATTRLRELEQQIATEVREAARQVQANQKRVDTTRTSRALAERRLEAEQTKFIAGTSTTFLVFQAQRDLVLARQTELRAAFDYAQSLVDFDTVKQAPLIGGGR